MKFNELLHPSIKLIDDVYIMPVLNEYCCVELKYPSVPRPITVDVSLFVRYVVETRFTRFAVETKFTRLAVETKLTNAAVLTYPIVPRPTTVDTRLTFVIPPLCI